MSGYIGVIWLVFSTITVVPRVTGQGLATERPVVPQNTGAAVRNSATKQVVPKQGLCRDGWSRGTMTEMFGKEIPICIQINPNPQTWTDAQTTCRKEYGFMLKLDSHVTVNNADIYSLLHTEDITEFWTGLHSEHGHLVWDDLLPNQLQPYNSVNATSTAIRPWSWNNDLTGDQQQYCGRMHIEAEDDYRRKKRSPDDDSNDNIFPGLNLANFRHRMNNGFGRRNNRYPPTSAFGSLLARTQMSDQLAELPGAIDLQNGNSQSESNSPDSDSQSGPVTTDTPTFGPMTTLDTDSDNLAFEVAGAGLGVETNEHELVSSVKNVAATLRPGMDVAQPDTPIEALKKLMSENLEALNNENPSSFENKASDLVGNGGSDGSQITDIVSAFGSAQFDSVSDEKPVQVESDNVGTETATTSGYLSTTAPESPSATFGDDKDKADLSPSSDEPRANIGDMPDAIDFSRPTNGGSSNVADNQSSNDEGSSKQLSEQFGTVVDSDDRSSVNDSPSLSDDSKTISDVPGNDIIDTAVDNLNDSPSDIKDIFENVADNVMQRHDENVDDVSSPDNTLGGINNSVEELSPPSENEFSPNIDLISDDIEADKTTNTEDNPVLYPQLNNLADIAEGIKDNLADRAEGIKDNLADRAEGINDNLADRAEGINDNLADRAEGIKDNLADRPEGIKDNSADRAEGNRDNLADRAEGIKDNLADRAEGIKDIFDDIKSDVNEQSIDLIPSSDDITLDRNLDDEKNSNKQIISNFPSMDDAPEIEPSVPSTNSLELLDTFEDKLEKIDSDDFPSDDTTEPGGTDNGLAEILNPMGISDDAITHLDNIDISDNMDDVELAGDLLDKIGDNKDSRLDELDLSDTVETVQDNLESNADRQLDDINNLSDDLSDQDVEPQNLARPSLNDDIQDLLESNINTGDFADSLAGADHENVQEIDEDLLPDETETLTDDLHDNTDSGNVDSKPNNDARDDFAEMLEPHENDLSEIDDVNENDHTQDVIDTTDSFTELGHDDKDILNDYEATTESRQADDMEVKRDFEWSDVGEQENDNQEVESGNSDIMSDDKALHDNNDFNEKELENRQVVVDGSFGLTKDDDQMDARDNENTRDNEDYENTRDNEDYENAKEGLTKEADSYPEDRDEGDTFNELPNLAEDVVEDNLKHSIAPVLNAEMKLSTCDLKLPSVCFSYEVLVSSGASTCEDGWYGHVLLDTCYTVLDRKMSYLAAVSRCKSLNARVIIASSEFERKYSLMAVQQDGKLHRGGKFWMESPSDKRKCKIFSERGTQTAPSCRAAMNVICVKDSKPLSVYSTNQISDVNDEVRFYDENGDYIMFTSEGDDSYLPCRLTSGASEFPVLWFKDGVMVSSKDKQVSQNLSLHIDQELLSSFGLITDRSLTTPTLQGQYWCEVWDRQTLTRMRSRAFNVRFSDVISFHGSMEVGEFNHENEVLFNMMSRKFPKLSAVEADIQKVFNDELSSIKAYIPSVQSVSTFIDGIRSDKPVIEYHAFFTMSRDYTTHEEQLLYSRLKAGLRSKIGNQNYIMDLPGHTPINSFRTMSLQSTVSCPGASLPTTKDIYGQTIPAKEFSFPATMLGEFANSLQNCSQTNQLPAGSARCLGDFYTGALWSEVVAYECIEEMIYDPQNEQKWAPSPYTAELTNLAEATADASNAERLVSEVAQIAKVAPKFTPTDINKIADVLDHTTQVRNLPKKVGENVLKTIDRLMADSFNEAHVANVETNAANRIIKSLERFAENADLGTQQQMRFVSDNVAVEIWDLEQAVKPVIGLAVETSSDGVSQPFKTNSISTVYNKSHLYDANVDAAIELPEEVFSKKEKGAMISDRLTMIVFRKSKLFQAAITDGGRRISPTDQQMAHLNSYVISASIAGKKIQDLNEKVKCIFKPKKESDGQNKCVWWDFTMNENKGGWSSMGCVYDGMVNGRDVCLCDHLTNFAVLIDFYGQGKPIPEHHELSLSIITVLGLSCSILGLSLTIISFLFFRKLRKGRAQQTLFNLSLSLLLAMLVFLVGIKQTHNDYVCIVVAILLHYFILVSFMWMLMEAILQYLTFVKILGTYITRFMLKTVLPAWGLPLLPVISVLSIDYNLYKGGPDYCWMDLSVFYYAFAVPVTCIIVINISIFIVTIISIFRRGKGLRSNQKKQKMAMTNLQAALTSFILLGLTWIFGYLAISDARLLFQYVFTILNSLQGFFIFILFVVRKKKVRDQWYIICCKGNEKDRVSRSLSASNSIPSTYSNGSRNSRKDGRDRDRSDSTKTIQSTYSNSSNGFTNYGYDHSYELPFNRHDRRAFRNF